MRILLVEDEEKGSRFIVRGLTAESFAVDAALNGQTGLELATTYNYDLMVLDLMLPGLSGTEVLRQIRHADHRVPILIEYALLEYLMANAARVLSRTMIIDHLWDQSFDGAANIVDVYVRHLRNKVDDGQETKLLRTVRGVGYKISDEADA